MEGLNRRARYIVKALNGVSDFAVENKVPTIVFCGDWFVPRMHVDFALVNIIRDWIIGLNKIGIKLVVVEGNHDKHAGDVDGVYVLKDYQDNLYFGNRNRDVGFVPVNEDYGFLIAPFVKDEKELRSQILSRLDKIRKVEPRPLILLAHTPVFHAKAPSGYSFPFGFVLDKKVQKNFIGGFFGDNHKYSELAKGFYSVGSLTQLNFGDVGGFRGFLSVSIDGGRLLVEREFDKSQPLFLAYNHPMDAATESVIGNVKKRDKRNHVRIVSKKLLSDSELEFYQGKFKYLEIVYSIESSKVVSDSRKFLVSKRDAFYEYLKENSKKGKFIFEGETYRYDKVIKRAEGLFNDTAE